MSAAEVINKLNDELGAYKFEFYPFKIDWYNSSVDQRFQLPHNKDTLGVLVLNTPRMFEELFLPYLFNNFKTNPDDLENLRDPIDNCLSEKFEEVRQKLEQSLNHKGGNLIEIKCIKDYEMEAATRRAKIVMQTCAHVSGAAYYYKQDLIVNKEELVKKKLLGLCLHKLYGGWFALRCVYVFKNLEVTDLEQVEPDDPLEGDSIKILDALKKFNWNWKDSTYRDTFEVLEKYSDIQQEYFSTEPRHRKLMIKKWLRFTDQTQLTSYYSIKKIYETDFKKYLLDNFFLI